VSGGSERAIPDCRANTGLEFEIPRGPWLLSSGPLESALGTPAPAFEQPRDVGLLILRCAIVGRRHILRVGRAHCGLARVALARILARATRATAAAPTQLTGNKCENGPGCNSFHDPAPMPSEAFRESEWSTFVRIRSGLTDLSSSNSSTFCRSLDSWN
jgi:hypothetical protein